MSRVSSIEVKYDGAIGRSLVSHDVTLYGTGCSDIIKTNVGRPVSFKLRTLEEAPGLAVGLVECVIEQQRWDAFRQSQMRQKHTRAEVIEAFADMVNALPTTMFTLT